MDTLIQDLRYSARMLAKATGFAAIAILTLALGVGANTAMFSVMQGVVLAPLRYFQPDRLVMVWESNPRFPRVWVSYPNFLDWQRRTATPKLYGRYSRPAPMSERVTAPPCGLP